MRELKFRVWVYYGENLKKPHYSRDYDGLDRFFEDHSENDTDQCIEQYTGLEDKNGKEIYEGDIVKLWDREPELVVWDNLIGAYDPLSWETFDADECEIIGNIHENPELLKEQE